MQDNANEDTEGGEPGYCVPGSEIGSTKPGDAFVIYLCLQISSPEKMISHTERGKKKQ